MTITNETIIKAAKAAGLSVTEVESFGAKILLNIGDFDVPIARAPHFNPLHSDTDNAMIRRGAEIDVGFWWESKDHPASVEATAWIRQKNGDMQDIAITVPSGTDKAQAEREAVILCAAAKFDAMQGEQK